MRNTLERAKDKTFKREYAFLLIAILLYSIYMNNVEMVTVIIWPILTYVSAAAGLHLFFKPRVNVEQMNNNESL